MSPDLEAAVNRHIEYLSEGRCVEIYQFIHPSVIKSLTHVFDAYRKRNKSNATNEEVFTELYEEYSYGDFEDRDFELIGEVLESQNIAHVIIRPAGAKYPLETPWVETLSFSMHEGDWRPLLTTYFIANAATEYEKEIEQGAVE